MCHLLPVITFTYACVPCYGNITTKDVCRSTQKAFFFMAVENKSKIAALFLVVLQSNTFEKKR